MSVTPEQVEELKILALFDLSSIQEGIKVHKAAGLPAIAATQRLHDKGLVTLNDGGYLTPLGVVAAEHAQALLAILGKDSVLGT